MNLTSFPDESLVGLKVDLVLEESTDYISKALNKKIEKEPLKAVSSVIIDELKPFTKAMNEKFDKVFDIPETVPLLDQIAPQNVDKEVVDTMKGKYEELIKTYMRNKYLLEALKVENNQYKKIFGALTKEEMIYLNMPNITNEVITVNDIEKAFKELE